MPLKQGYETSITTPPASHGSTGWKTDGELYAHNAGGTETKLTLTAISVTGTRDDPESALANLLTALATQGIIIDNTTAT